MPNMFDIKNEMLGTLLRTLSGAFSPQIAAAIGDVLLLMKQYDDRLERVERMVQELLLRERSTYVIPSIEDQSDAKRS